MNILHRHIETLIFTSPQPITVEQLRSCLTEMYADNNPPGNQEIINAIEILINRYQSEEYAFEIIHIAGGYCFMTKPAYQALVGVSLKQTSKKKLSKSAVETLAVIAYKQPITKTDIELIRGVNSDYAIKKLLERELIEIKGKSEAVGRPMLYGTTTGFLTHFGINSLKELPTLKDFSEEASEIGEERNE